MKYIVTEAASPSSIRLRACGPKLYLMMRFDVESWVWFAIALGSIIARLVSRLLLFRSVKRFQYDDWIMGVVVTGCFTVLVVMSNIVARSQSNLLPPGFKVETLTPQQISHREYGSKIVVVVEQMQIAVIWACKSCLLLLYLQLTHMVATKRNLATKLLAIYVAFGFVVMEILYFAAWCRPFHEYWSIAPHSSQCTALTNHRIVNAVFNISSDLIMLCIAIPMFIRSLLPLKRKLILCCIFSLGIFVVGGVHIDGECSLIFPGACIGVKQILLIHAALRTDVGVLVCP